MIEKTGAGSHRLADQAGPLLHTTRFRLTYADTDAAQILYFAAWFPWMERANLEWLLEQGIRFDRMQQELGVSQVVRATECEYLARALVYDLIELTLHLEHVGTSSYRIGYRMTRLDDGVQVARAAITAVMVGADGRPAGHLPEPFLAAFGRARGDRASGPA